MSKVTVAVIIVAAGRGARAGAGLPKQYRDLAGQSVLRRTLRVFEHHPALGPIVCVINEADRALYDAAVAGLDIADPVFGGKNRQTSVYNGLVALAATAPRYVLIHDAARPFVSPMLIDTLLATLKGGAKSVLPALAVVDTLKFAKDGVVEQTVSRDGLFRAQTPQGFVFEDILSAHEASKNQEHTDDVALAEKAGFSTVIIDGEDDNIKLTHASDFKKAEKILMTSQVIRTGQGYDVHRFKAGDHVWLCGVKVPHSKALEGHSDADVAMHALTDALYGAIAKGDIGVHFPPSDPQWKGAASHIFLAHAAGLVASMGGEIHNVDVTILCEEPKIAPHQTAMRSALAKIMDIDADRVSVKATTTEKLGFTGRGEGIAAQAIATVSLPRSVQ